MTATGISILGGIASAVLVTASPANAAIVAGLAATSTGMTALDSKASELDLTYSASTQLKAGYENQVAIAYAKLNQESLIGLRAKARTAKTPDEWYAALEKVELAVGLYRTAVLHPEVIVNVSSVDDNQPQDELNTTGALVGGDGEGTS